VSYRIVLWTTGHVARFAGRAIVEHPDLELVGAYAWSPEKVGRDVGELIGTEPLGIVATADVDELLALRPDVVGYYQILRPDAIEEHTATLCRFLEAGVNVVSTSNLITGRWWSATERFDAAGRAGNASLFASGVNPGFVNQLVLTATGVCSDVRGLSVWEEAECSGYDSPDLWETVAFGHRPGEPGIEAAFRAGPRRRVAQPLAGHRRGPRGHRAGDDLEDDRGRRTELADPPPVARPHRRHTDGEAAPRGLAAGG
jgi:hypothetical protein